MSPGSREQALLLGKRKTLVGVLTPAIARPDRIQRPVVVMLNAGIIHRVGPNRLHVEAARALAAEGFSSLRFDLSGVGDSEKRADGLPLLEASLADVREVLDWLEANRGARRFILLGLCSGADHALLHAGSDPRVAGVILLDPSIPRTRGYYLRHYGRRLLRLRSWWNVAGALPGLLGRVAVPVRAMRTQRGASATPDPAKTPAEPSVDSPEARAFLKLAYQKAIDQGCEILAVVTGDLETRHNYREQLLDAMRGVTFGDKLRLERFGNSDHTLSFEAERRAVLRLIVDWVGTRPCRPVAAGESPKVLAGELTTS